MLLRRTFSLLLWMTLATGVGTVSCSKKSNSTPANYDVLAKQQGYWEWQRSVTEGPVVSPASVGFSRQLVFGADHQLIIRRNGQPHSQVPFQLSEGTLPRCGSPQLVMPIVTFTAEPEVANNARKVYSVDVTPAGTTLSLVGEDACFDGGYYETYLWHAE